MERFRANEAGTHPDVPGWDPTFGDLVGVYVNGADTAGPDRIYIFVHGLAWRSVEWHRVRFQDVVQVRAPFPKGRADDLRIETSTAVHLLPVRGRRDRFQDVYEFTRFLMRVTKS